MTEVGRDQVPAVRHERAGGDVWLGLETDYDRLLDALEGGWLVPGTEAGQDLGVGHFWDGGAAQANSERLRVRVRVEVKKLPSIAVPAWTNGDWHNVGVHEVGRSGGSLLRWPRPLPAFSFSRILVRSEEERDRLLGMAEGTSTVSLPREVVEVSSPAPAEVAPTTEPGPAVSGNVLPDDLDAYHGAMSTATHFVPRMEPWLKLLAASLNPDCPDLPRLAEGVDAEWWKVPPWFRADSVAALESLDDCLWRAAIEEFRVRERRDGIGPTALAHEIHDAACQTASPEVCEAAHNWLRVTERILETEAEIRIGEWRRNPVGLAVQLVLLRPDPDEFASWLSDRPDLPPGVAWSAAALCGLYSGYRRLDRPFRGSEWRREVLAIHALRLSTEDGAAESWPTHSDPAPQIERAQERLRLLWDGKPIWEKSLSARGAWLDADYGASDNEERASAIARELHWPCLRYVCELPEGTSELFGPGKVTITGRKPTKKMKVEGELSLALPSDPQVRPRLDHDGLRRCLTTEGGLVRVRPQREASLVAEERSPLVQRRGQLPPLAERGLIPGLRYVPGFLSEDEEARLLEDINRAEWDDRMQRRVQHYGWRYEYKARRVDPSMRLGALPEWADRLAHRLVDRGLVSELPDQVIVNEYQGNQGISKHSDARTFGEDVATVSLLESWPMIFRKNREAATLVLERRSVAIMSGEARWNWTHEIPKNKNLHRSSEPRGRRISLTFRRVVESAAAGADDQGCRASPNGPMASRPDQGGENAGYSRKTAEQAGSETRTLFNQAGPQRPVGVGANE